jgi:hypothetical protein
MAKWLWHSLLPAIHGAIVTFCCALLCHSCTACLCRLQVPNFHVALYAALGLAPDCNMTAVLELWDEAHPSIPALNTLHFMSTVRWGGGWDRGDGCYNQKVGTCSHVVVSERQGMHTCR